MSKPSAEELQKQIHMLDEKLAQAQQREAYYKEIAAQAGRKRLRETRNLSDLVSKYRESQSELQAHRDHLEELVHERTEKLERANAQLLSYIEEQKKTQEKLQYRLELEHVILDISSDFINLPVEQTDAGIQRGLQRIARFTQSCQSALYLLSEETDTVLNSHLWHMPETERAANSNSHTHDALFGYYSSILRQNKIILLQAEKDLKDLLGQHISPNHKGPFQPLLAVPLAHDGKIYASLALFGKPKQRMSWPHELVSFLKIIGGFFVSALEQKVSEMALRESEERYRNLVEKAGLAIVIDGVDGTFHYHNQRFLELFGYSEEDLKHLNMKDILHPEDLDRVWAIHNRRFAGQSSPSHYEFRGIKKDGSTVYLEVDVVELLQDDKIIATRSYIWDISRRVEIEHAIQLTEERYRNLIENLQDLVLIVDFNGSFLYANPILEKQLGFTSKDFQSFEQMRSLVFEEDAEYGYALNEQFISSQQQHSQPFEVRLCGKDDTIHYYSIIISRITYGGKPALQYIGHNISNLKIAEQALKRSADFEKTVSEISSQFLTSRITTESITRALKAMGQLSQSSRAMLYNIDIDTQSLSAEAEWCASGVASDLSSRQHIPIQNWEFWKQRFDQENILHVPDTTHLPAEAETEQQIVLQHGIKSLVILPFKVRGAYHSAISFEHIEHTGPWSEQDIQLLQISSEIISTAFERRQADEMLRKSEEQYRLLFDKNNDQIFLHKIDDELKPTRFINVNERACEKLGYSKEELLQLTVYDIDAKEEQQKIQNNSRILLERKSHLFETIHVTRNGELCPVEINAHIVEMDGEQVVFSIARDISERKQIEEEIQKSQRLESIGVLAGGIAHDFNNLLSIILGNAQLLRTKSTDTETIAKYIQNIEQGATQASHLTQQLLTFARGGEPIKSKTRLEDLIRESVQLALSGLEKTAEFQMAENLWPAEIDKGQIRQVLHNLVLNADQAMPGNGEIVVSSQNVTASEVNALRALESHYFVEIRIQDFGEGIPETEIEKIFDPYYTTKESGSGLGLTVAYSIVRKHQGLLTVESKVGQGTTVHIYLPAMPTEAVRQAAKRQSFENCRGKLLVMDDEDLVLDMIRDLLTDIGFEVACVKEGEQLLQAYKAAQHDGTPFDAVIMDLTISKGMGGKATIERLRQLDPQVKALVSSGYSNDTIMANYASYGFDGVVAKPFTLDELCEALTQLLDMEDAKHR